MKKDLKRCPKCESSNIRKRSRILLGSGSKKGLWVKLPIDKRERITKYYRCYKCKHEFDNPLVVE
jgi:predicted Zn-ribbon and HTH transcriptional regulator